MHRITFHAHLHLFCNKLNLYILFFNLWNSKIISATFLSAFLVLEIILPPPQIPFRINYRNFTTHTAIQQLKYCDSVWIVFTVLHALQNHCGDGGDKKHFYWPIEKMQLGKWVWILEYVPFCISQCMVQLLPKPRCRK